MCIMTLSVLKFFIFFSKTVTNFEILVAEPLHILNMLNQIKTIYTYIYICMYIHTPAHT